MNKYIQWGPNMTDYKKAKIICELIQQQQTPTPEMKAEFKRLVGNGYIKLCGNKIYAINKGANND